MGNCLCSDHGPAHVGEAAPSSCEREEGWGRRVGNSGNPIYFCSPGKERTQFSTVTPLYCCGSPCAHPGGAMHRAGASSVGSGSFGFGFWFKLVIFMLIQGWLKYKFVF